MPKHGLMSNLHLNLSNAHLFLLQKGNQICTIFFCQDCTFFCQINTFFQYRNEPNRKKLNPSNSQEKKGADLTMFQIELLFGPKIWFFFIIRHTNPAKVCFFPSVQNLNRQANGHLPLITTLEHKITGFFKADEPFQKYIINSFIYQKIELISKCF